MKTFFINPGGNPTILVDNLKGQISRKNYAKISRELLDKEKKFEQVGFIEKGSNGRLRCQMMGGEFCVNALRSLGLWVYEQYSQKTFELESSGTEKTFSINIENWVGIQLSSKYSLKRLSKFLYMVELEGITHFVKNIKRNKWNEKKFRRDLQYLIKKYSKELKNIPAIGLIAFDEENKIYPLVFVRETKSLIYETACGSGTIAAFLTTEKVADCIWQPSGFPYLVGKKDDNIELTSVVQFFL